MIKKIILTALIIFVCFAGQAQISKQDTIIPKRFILWGANYSRSQSNIFKIGFNYGVESLFLVDTNSEFCVTSYGITSFNYFDNNKFITQLNGGVQIPINIIRNKIQFYPDFALCFIDNSNIFNFDLYGGVGIRFNIKKSSIKLEAGTYLIYNSKFLGARLIIVNF